jgi:CRISPR/Cas system-associated exonuclease Cas4 (RecB family)
LLNLPAIWEKETSEIKLRGYNRDEPVAISSGFLMQKLDGSFQTLSVEQIASKYCPVRRDLYLQVIKKNQGRKTSGRIAGPLIEAYCKGLLDSDTRLCLSYEDLQASVESYTKSFVKKHQRQFDDLEKEARYGGREDALGEFLLRLEYTARYEIAILGADWLLRRFGRKGVRPLLSQVPIKYEQDVLKIEPAEHVGIGELASPDFIITEPLAIGDVKSGDVLKRFHLHACAGYAIAYESQFGVGNEVNYGVIYFFETHGTALSTAQCYAFLIDNSLRQEFLNARDEAYRVLQSPAPPLPLVGEDQKIYCTYCKYREECDKDRATPN